MISDKLITLLQTLSKVMRNRFRKYLLSPYLNDQPELVPLYDLLDQAIREDKAASLDKHQVWKRLYPAQSFNDAQLRRMTSDINQLCLQFLAAEARKENPLAEALDLQRLLDKPELKKHLSGVERQIQKLLADQQDYSSDYYHACFNLYHQIFSRAAKTIATAGYGEKLWVADRHLEYFYLTQKVKYYVNWLLYTRSRASEKEISLSARVLESFRQPEFQTVPLLAIYEKIILCLSEQENDQHFKSLLEIIEAKGQALSTSDLRECYQIAQNYCAIKINQGKREYYREMFDIFKKIIQKDILLESGNLSEGLFKNIVTVGLGVGEYVWVEDFIQTYTPFLPSDIRENARTFNLASLHFHQKRFEQVIALIHDVEYSDLVYALSAKQLLVRTYFELGEYLVLDSLIDSFKIYLRRNKQISKTQKQEYLNFLSFVKNLTVLNPRDRQKIQKLSSRIEKASSVMPKKWLLEKIEALKRR
jgi:hypothetical protein